MRAAQHQHIWAAIHPVVSNIASAPNCTSGSFSSRPSSSMIGTSNGVGTKRQSGVVSAAMDRVLVGFGFRRGFGGDDRQSAEPLSILLLPLPHGRFGFDHSADGQISGKSRFHRLQRQCGGGVAGDHDSSLGLNDRARYVMICRTEIRSRSPWSLNHTASGRCRRNK